jgi:hypothetical protein
MSGIPNDSSELEDEPLHNEDKLFSISSWANIISWVALSGYILAFLGRVVTAFQGAPQDTVVIQEPSFFIVTTQFNFWVNSLFLLITGTTYFLILQAVSQGILMLMDIEEDGRK